MHTHSHPSQRTQALLMLVLATFFWGLSFPVIKSLMLIHARIEPVAGTWFLTAYVLAPRFLLGAALLALWQWRSLGDWRRGEWKQGVVIGLFSTVGMIFQCDGMQFTSASTSAFLTQFYAILIPIYVAARVRTWPGGRVWLSCALVLAGVAILGRFDWQALRLGRGEVETLIASVFFMGQILYLERPEFAGNRADKVTLAMFVTQAVILCGLTGWLAPSVGALVTPWTSLPWLELTLVLTVFCTIGSYSLMNAWQPKITATEAGLIYCVEPIFGSAVALFLPAIFSVWGEIGYANEVATWTLLIGGGLITAANVLIQVKPAGR